jgi:C4-dicarboxylate-specific signal transduction histidine kinase
LSRIGVDSAALERQQEPAWVDGDAVQIQIAIVNLLRNAAEALSEGAVPDPWVRLSLMAEDGLWCLSVEDNGPGLPPAVLDDTPLQTTKTSGSGLGLFVVRTTMENHHGVLRCGTSARGGAALQLLFPAMPGPENIDQALPTTGD